MERNGVCKYTSCTRTNGMVAGWSGLGVFDIEDMIKLDNEIVLEVFEIN